MGNHNNIYNRAGTGRNILKEMKQHQLTLVICICLGAGYLFGVYSNIDHSTHWSKERNIVHDKEASILTSYLKVLEESKLKTIESDSLSKPTTVSGKLQLDNEYTNGISAPNNVPQNSDSSKSTSSPIQVPEEIKIKSDSSRIMSPSSQVSGVVLSGSGEGKNTQATAPQPKEVEIKVFKSKQVSESSEDSGEVMTVKGVQKKQTTQLLKDSQVKSNEPSQEAKVSEDKIEASPKDLLELATVPSFVAPLDADEQGKGVSSNWYRKTMKDKKLRKNKSSQSPKFGKHMSTATEVATDNTMPTNVTEEVNSRAYGVDTSVCKIPELDPVDPTILKHVSPYLGPEGECPRPIMLTYQEGNIIKINHTLLHEIYTNNTIKCRYRYILKDKDTDQKIIFSKYMQMDMSKGYFKMLDDFVRVTCYTVKDYEFVEFYRHFHSMPVEDFPQKASGKRTIHDWNVMLIGTDSISSSAALRYMPKTVKFLKEKLQAINFHGYTKVGLNTLPNMTPFLTGYSADEMINSELKLDYLPLLFKNYSKADYTTFFGEDRPTGAIFQYELQGFRNKPSDHYFLPFSLAIDEPKNWTMKDGGCTRKFYLPREIYDYLTQFADKYKNKKHFSLTFTSGLSHDYNHDARMLDHLYPELLKNLESLGIFENTILFFFGDHGARWGEIMKTYVGKMEGKLPAMYIAFPEKFRKQYPNYMRNVLRNSRRLTTPFDMYKTLIHILDLGKEMSKNTLRSMSILSEIPENRTCETAGVALQFCTCLKGEKVDTTYPMVQESGKFIVQKMNEILNEAKSVCAKLTMVKIYFASKLKVSIASNTYSYEHYQVTVGTSPGKGIFEGTVRVSKTEQDDLLFDMEGPIARENKYGNTSSCVHKPLLHLYCYCKSNLKSGQTSS